MLQAVPEDVGKELFLLAEKLRGISEAERSRSLFITLLSLTQGDCYPLHLDSKAPFPHSELPRDIYS